MNIQKLSYYLFGILLFFVPLILWPYTSEVFEFNKIVVVYLLTILISTTWVARMIVERKFIFRRTILDIPLLLFLGSQIISTFLSIDFYTSFYGYYSRFNGGLLSSIGYAILYWAFVSNLDRKDVPRLINYSLMPSAFLVSVYAVLEHYGIDKNIWVQDVQSRVFSTLGQPNWLAAWIVTLIPLCWASAISNFQLPISNEFSNSRLKNFIFNFLLSILLFTTLLFTKSRSGLAGFIVADAIFWTILLIKKLRISFIPFIIYHLSFIILILLIGTQWTPSLNSLLNKSSLKTDNQITSGTALESGGTESGTIRKIVWQGALKIWQNYPVFGTGVETYAFSYYLFRPVAHNITSEWDFIYNKAHNEFLNFAANTGTVGLLSYLAVIIFSIIQISNHLISLISKKAPISQIKNSENRLDQFEIGTFHLALFAGFISLSVSNFFGFSVVPTQLQFFLFPAFAAILTTNQEVISKTEKLKPVQKFFILLLLAFAFYFLLLVYRYWQSDVLYAKAKAENSVKRPDIAIPLLNQAIKYEPWQSIYYSESANSYSMLAMAYQQNEDATASSEFTNLAVSQIQKAVNLAPANVSLLRMMFGIYVRLSTIDEKYLIQAKDTLLSAIKIAPTDPKLEYNLGVTYANLGDYPNASLSFEKAIELKPNYTDARIEYAAILNHLNQKENAKKQLKYILENLDPTNSTALQALENLY